MLRRVLVPGRKLRRNYYGVVRCDRALFCTYAVREALDGRECVTTIII